MPRKRMLCGCTQPRVEGAKSPDAGQRPRSRCRPGNISRMSERPAADSDSATLRLAIAHLENGTPRGHNSGHRPWCSLTICALTAEHWMSDPQVRAAVAGAVPSSTCPVNVSAAPRVVLPARPSEVPPRRAASWPSWAPATVIAREGGPMAARECTGLALPTATRKTRKALRVVSGAAWTDTWLDTLTGVVQAVQPRLSMSSWSSVDTAWTRRRVQPANARRIDAFFDPLLSAWTRDPAKMSKQKTRKMPCPSRTLKLITLPPPRRGLFASPPGHSR